MADFDLFNYDTNPPALYQQYAPPVTSTSLTTNVEAGTIVTTINGASGPNINFSSSIGFAFTGGGSGAVVMSVSNPALARSALGAAESGVNTDITELNGASQVDVSGSYKVDGTQVVAEQQPAIPDAAGGATVDTEARAAINSLLAALRTHGLIDT